MSQAYVIWNEKQWAMEVGFGNLCEEVHAVIDILLNDES